MLAHGAGSILPQAFCGMPNVIVDADRSADQYGADSAIQLPRQTGLAIRELKEGWKSKAA
jgi:hypothetical protein